MIDVENKEGVGVQTYERPLISATCSPGHFYNVQTHTCAVCPTGTYQMEYGQNFCIACPGDTVTDGSATANVSECKSNDLQLNLSLKTQIETSQYSAFYVKLTCL